MHLISFLIDSPINHSILSWTDPQDERIDGLASYTYWQDLARTLERGKFDAVFFADAPGVYDRYLERSDEAVRYGVCWPGLDPMQALPAMGAVTEHLGLAVTMSVSALPPFSVVRALSTLDYMSSGRAGWNVVTGHLRGEHRALGNDQLGHDARYDKADEFMEVCRKFWAGVKPGAILMNKETGEFADPSKVDVIVHEGEFYRTHTVPPVLPSPQGHPVIFQAGSSGRGLKFAIKNAEVMFSIQPHLAGMQRYMSQLKQVAEEAGRVDPPVTFGVQPVIGGTEEEAKRTYQDIRERIPIEAALSRLSGSLGVNFDEFELDLPMEEVGTEASQGMMKAMTAMVGGEARMTLREVVMRWGTAVGMLPIIGTPEQIADELERLWRETGCLGFNVTPTTNDRSIRTFVDEVVPILQKRGIYRTEYSSTTLRGNLTD